MRSYKSLIITFVVSGALAACGGSAPPAETPAPEPSASAEPTPPAETKPEEAKPEEKPAEAKPETPPAKVAWADMTKEQKIELMKTEVVPKLGALFKEYDAKEFAEFGCKTCHGEGAKEGKFEMPNAKLPKLDPKDGFAKHKKQAKMLEFMGKKVVPEMATILGTTPFDPEKKTGFGCMGCHTMVGK